MRKNANPLGIASVESANFTGTNSPVCRRKSLSKAATLGLNSPSGKSYEI